MARDETSEASINLATPLAGLSPFNENNTKNLAAATLGENHLSEVQICQFGIRVTPLPSLMKWRTYWKPSRNTNHIHASKRQYLNVPAARTRTWYANLLIMSLGTIRLHPRSYASWRIVLGNTQSRNQFCGACGWTVILDDDTDPRPDDWKHTAEPVCRFRWPHFRQESLRWNVEIWHYPLFRLPIRPTYTPGA